MCALPAGDADAALARFGCAADVTTLDPHTLDEVLATITETGPRLGVTDRAEAMVADLRRRLAASREVGDGSTGRLGRGCSSSSGPTRRSSPATGSPTSSPPPAAIPCWPSAVADRCRPTGRRSPSTTPTSSSSRRAASASTAQPRRPRRCSTDSPTAPPSGRSTPTGWSSVRARAWSTASRRCRASSIWRRASPPVDPPDPMTDPVDALRDDLRAVAVPADAAPMAAYMKDRFVFLGVKTPARRTASKPLITASQHEPIDEWSPWRTSSGHSPSASSTTSRATCSGQPDGASAPSTSPTSNVSSPPMPGGTPSMPGVADHRHDGAQPPVVATVDGRVDR